MPRNLLLFGLSLALAACAASNKSSLPNRVNAPAPRAEAPLFTHFMKGHWLYYAGSWGSKSMSGEITSTPVGDRIELAADDSKWRPVEYKVSIHADGTHLDPIVGEHRVAAFICNYVDQRLIVCHRKGMSPTKYSAVFEEHE